MVNRGVTFGRYLGHEGGALVNGINALVRRDLRKMISLFTM
jgi:hypothetical protein